jgi:hypothetical protein
LPGPALTLSVVWPNEQRLCDMFDVMLANAVVWLLLGLPSYGTGWLLLRLCGREVESVKTWWSRVVASGQAKGKRNAFLKYTKDGREILTAEYAFQVGCLFWVGLLLLLPLAIWFLYSLLV